MVLLCNLVCCSLFHSKVTKLNIVQGGFCGGGHGGKYSNDIRIYNCEFSNRIAGKRSNIRNFEYESNILPY